jgi:hypothetical protein
MDRITTFEINGRWYWKRRRRGHPVGRNRGDGGYAERADCRRVARDLTRHPRGRL